MGFSWWTLQRMDHRKKLRSKTKSKKKKKRKKKKEDEALVENNESMKIFACKKCDKTFLSKRALGGHQAVHSTKNKKKKKSPKPATKEPYWEESEDSDNDEHKTEVVVI